MELFDLVDRDNNVIGITNKETAHAQRLPHRVAAVFVFNENDELYLQVHKKSNNRYDSSVGGHVMQGETFEAAAQREAKEELGLNEPLTKITTFYTERGSYVHVFGLFACRAQTGWKFQPNDEVGEIVSMSLVEIDQLLATHPERFTNGFISNYEHYTQYLKNTKQ